MSIEDVVRLLTLLLVKPLFIVLIVIIGLAFLHRKSAALQHFWLAMGMIALLLLPLFFGLLPEISWPILPAFNGVPSDAIFSSVYAAIVWINDPLSWMLIAAIYFLGAFWLLFYLLLGCIALLVQTRQAKICDDHELTHLLAELSDELGIARRVTLRCSDAVQAPQMWGVITPVIMLPADAACWANERKLSVLLHELGHVVRCDWATTLMVKICCAFFWFLPPVWWLGARLFHCAEVACDDYIYRLHNHYQLRNKAITYAENLLAMARPRGEKQPVHIEPAVPMAGRSAIFYRIEAILDHQRSRENASPETRQYWVLVLLIMLLPTASLQLIPIREILNASMLTIQLPLPQQNNKDKFLTLQDQIPVHRMNAETLSKLKQQLVFENANTKSPRFPLEEMTVTAIQNVVEKQDFKRDLAGLSDFRDIEPVIRIEGYMPLETVIPEYPRSALQHGIEGEVVVEFSIKQDGSITDARILHSQPRYKFDRAVLSALQRSRYKPQIIDGQSVVIQGVIETFTFQIEQSPLAEPRRR